MKKIIDKFKKKLNLTLIKKQNLKFKVILMQFIIVVASLNIASSIFISSLIPKMNFNSLINLSNSYIINIIANKDKNVLANYSESLEKITTDIPIKNSGRYYIKDIFINNDTYSGIFLDEESIDMYNLDLLKDTEPSIETDTINVLLSEDLKGNYSVGDFVNISTDFKDINCKVIGYLNKKFWTENLNSKVDVKPLKNSIIIPFGKNGFYEKNIDYKMFDSIIIESSSSDIENKLDKLKDEKVINSYSQSCKYFLKINDENMQQGFICISIALILSAFSLIGFIGVIFSYKNIIYNQYSDPTEQNKINTKFKKIVFIEITLSIVLSLIISITYIQNLNTNYIISVQLLLDIVILILLYFLLNLLLKSDRYTELFKFK